MKLDLKLKNSPLILKLNSYRSINFELHITSLLILMLSLIGSSFLISIQKAILIILAYISLEIVLVFKLLTLKKDNSNANSLRIMPFGVISNFENKNFKLQKNKFYSNSIILFISLVFLLNLYTFPNNDSILLDNFHFFLTILLILSSINLIPLFGSSSYSFFKELIKDNKLNNNFYFKYFPLILIIITNFYYSNILLLILSYVFITYSIKERFLDKTKETAKKLKVNVAYTPIEKLISFNLKDNTKNLYSEAIRYSQSFFLVYEKENVVGYIEKDQIFELLTSSEDNTLKSILISSNHELDVEDSLLKALEIFKNSDTDIIIIKEKSEIKGVIYQENLMEFLLMHDMIKKIEKQKELFSDDIF